MSTGKNKDQDARETPVVAESELEQQPQNSGRRPPPPPPPPAGHSTQAFGAMTHPPESEEDERGEDELIEPADPPTPPPTPVSPPPEMGPEEIPLTIESAHSGEPDRSGEQVSAYDPSGPPITIEPRRKVEGKRAITVNSMDVVAVEETNQRVARLDPIEPVESDGVDLPIDVELPEDEPAPAELLPTAPASMVGQPEMESASVSPLEDEAAAPKLSASADSVLTSLHAFVEQELDDADVEDRRKRALLLFEMGHLEETIFRDAEQSLRRYQQSFELDDSFVPTLRALRRRYADDDRWRDYVKVLQAEIEVSRGERERAMLLTLHGEALWRRLGERDAAVESLQAALTLVPRNRRALEVLRAIFSEIKRWDELLATLRQLANTTSDPAERARLTVEMAELAELRLDDSASAEELYAQALDLDPANEKALVELRRLYLLHRRWQRLSELLAREAGQEYEPSEMYADLYRSARISETHLHDDARAASLLETVAALRPRDALPLQTLVEVYQRTGRSEDLATALSRQARLARDPLVKADLFYRMGQLYQEWLGRPEKALEIYRQALKEQPNHEATLRAVSDLYRRLECWEDLLDIELLLAERQHDAASRADGYLRAARVCELKLKDLARAVELYGRAWQVKHGQLEAFRALDRIYRTTNKWEPLAQLCQERAGTTSDGSLSVALWREAALIFDERLSQPEQAIAALETLRQDHPYDREALMHLARLYESAGRLDDLRRVLEEWAEQSEDADEKAELRRRLAELLERTLGHPEAAAATYREMVAQNPHDDVARARLKALYERTGRWSDLVETLEAEVVRQERSADEAAILLQIGRLCEDKLGEAGKARESYERALARDPSCTPAAVALEDSLRRGEQWLPLVDLLVAQAEGMRDASFAAGALCRAAEVCEERLAAQQRAIELYGRALDLDPSCEPARHGLERIYLALNDTAALESHYLREAEEAGNPLLRVRAYVRLAALFERGGDGADAAAAADAYAAALKVVEDQPDALNGLAALCRRGGQWQKLAELLGRIAASATDRAAALSALKEWAAILEAHQSAEWDPTPIYERILDGDPQDPNAIDALERLAYRTGDTDSLTRLAVLQMEIYADKSWVAALCMRAAVISVAASRSSEAVELLRRCLASAPRYLPAIRLLRRLQEQLGVYPDVANLLQQEAELVASTSSRHQLLHRAATIMLEQLDEVDGARQTLEQIFAVDPRHAGAFELLAGILRRSGEWRSLVDLYRRRLAVVEQAQAGPLQMDLAELYQERLSDPGAAIQVLAELLAVEPELAPALERIARLCIDQGRWREAEEYLGRLAALVREDPERRRWAFFERIDLLSEQLAEEEEALEALDELLRRERGDREALERVVRICRRRGDWDQTVRALDDLARSGTPEQRVMSLVDLAEIASRSLNDAQRSSAALRDAARLCLDGPTALTRLASFFERRGDFDGYAQLLSATLDRLPPEGAPGAVELRLALARLLAGRLLRPEEAEQEVREALRSEPNSLEARLELAGLYLWGNRLDDAALEYRRALDLDPMSVAAFRGLYRVADRAGAADQAGAAAQVVCALSQASEPEQESADEFVAELERLIAEPHAALEVQTYWNLLAEGQVPRAALALLHALADYLPQVDLALPPEGHGELPLMPLEAQHPLGLRCRQVAQLLGLAELSCYLSNALARPGEVRLTPKLGLVLNSEFAGRAPESQVRFVAGRAAGLIASSSAYLYLLPARTLELVLAAAAEPFEKGFGSYLGQPEALEAMGRQLSRAIPRKVRRSLEQPARAYVAEGQLDVPRAQSVALRAAARAGVVVAGEIPAVLEVLKAENADRHVRADLLRFAVSKQLQEVRARLGLHG
jgi:tetratricopeptide (TPR) repeat protein